MRSLKVGVIGIGRLGSFHLQKYQNLEGCQVTAVADTDAKRLKRFGRTREIKSVTDYREILEDVEAVSIATPTSTHFEIARECLRRGIHTLVEKPICTTPSEAEILLKEAERAGVKLQVGHVERFNPAVLKADALVDTPLFLEIHRLGNFSKRGTDVDVILDLMIHDLDLVNHYVKSPVRLVSAAGVPVLTPQGDIANVRLEFENGCVANLTASRVSREKTRKFRIFQPNGYLSIDLLNHEVTWVRKITKQVLGRPVVFPRKLKVPKIDALEAEISSFVRAVVRDQPVEVSGEDGLNALVLAIKIKEEMQKRLQTALSHSRS